MVMSWIWTGIVGISILFAIINGSNGILFESGDAAALADGLARLRNDAALRESLSGQARSDLSSFSPERMADSYMALYQDICGAG